MIINMNIHVMFLCGMTWFEVSDVRIALGSSLSPEMQCHIILFRDWLWIPIADIRDVREK